MVEWGEPMPLADAATAAPPVPAGAELAASGGTMPHSVGRCDGSVRVARFGGEMRVAVWWSARPDSSVALLSARSDDGGRSWGATVPVDSTDRSVAGCRRPPPAIAADSTTTYVHVTYSLLGPQGPGVFFSHSMDRGALFHAPVPIVYGERPAHTSVAAQGDVVVVAYEDPNARRPTIGLALSHTMGHVFDAREADSAPLGGVLPHVALRGGRLALSWTRRTADGRTVRMVREGTLR